jgi:hypothetical protein
LRRWSAPSPDTSINGDTKLDAEIRSKFSLCRAIASQFDHSVDAGFEREVQAWSWQPAPGVPLRASIIPTEIFEKPRAHHKRGGRPHFNGPPPGSTSTR